MKLGVYTARDTPPLRSRGGGRGVGSTRLARSSIGVLKNDAYNERDEPPMLDVLWLTFFAMISWLVILRVDSPWTKHEFRVVAILLAVLVGGKFLLKIAPDYEGSFLGLLNAIAIGAVVVAKRAHPHVEESDSELVTSRRFKLTSRVVWLLVIAAVSLGLSFALDRTHLTSDNGLLPEIAFQSYALILILSSANNFQVAESLMRRVCGVLGIATPRPKEWGQGAAP